jgi:ABC-type Zn uptake system ZnuABC Zn-binding protein ZnuA
VSRRRLCALAVLAPLVVASLSSCASGSGRAGAASASSPARLQVVTALFPLAQAAQQIGRGHVNVIDVVPPGDDPLSYGLSPTQASSVASADLVLEVGGDFQPSFEAAARRARRVFALSGALGPSAEWSWLDPATIEKALPYLAKAMEAADPRDSASFRQAASDFTQLINSTNIDYESTLSACPRSVIATADGSFSSMAHTYGLTDVQIGLSARPGASAVERAASELVSSAVTTAFAEPWVPDQLVYDAARAAHVRVATLDTLLGPPAGGWRSLEGATGNPYIDLLEANLGALNSALGCPGPSEG